jgi:hypothetical protein
VFVDPGSAGWDPTSSHNIVLDAAGATMFYIHLWNTSCILFCKSTSRIMFKHIDRGNYGTPTVAVAALLYGVSNQHVELQQLCKYYSNFKQYGIRWFITQRCVLVQH